MQDRQQQYVELYESKYEDFIQEGKSPTQSQALAYECVEHAKEIIEGVSFSFENGYYVAEDGSVHETQEDAYKAKKEDTTLNIDNLEKIEGEFYTNLRYTVDLNNITKWNELDDHSKELALFNHGIDINMPVKVTHGLMARKNAPPIETTYAVGSERLDYEHIHSGRATLDAILEFERISRGFDHYRDLKEMSRQ